MLRLLSLDNPITHIVCGLSESAAFSGFHRLIDGPLNHSFMHSAIRRAVEGTVSVYLGTLKVKSS